MRTVTLTKTINRNGIKFTARKPTKDFTNGDVVKFIFPAGEKLAVVRVGATANIDQSACDRCIFKKQTEMRCHAPTANKLILCAYIDDHYGRFEPIELVLEEL